jgi:arylsulfatase A-like enzyme
MLGIEFLQSSSGGEKRMSNDQNGRNVAISRRDFLQKSVAATGTAVAGSVLPRVLGQSGMKKRPNIVFFYTEGQRADALSLSGNLILKTPHQDRIGREGVCFTNSFCTNALCAPARAVTLTGLYSHTSGALDNKTTAALPPDIPIFTDLLHETGYDVAMVGKAHIGNGVRERYWDYYFAFNSAVTDYYFPHAFEGRKGVMGEEKIYRGESRGDFRDNSALDRTGVYADDLFTDRALDWLKQERDRPFCLLLWLQAPHAPFYRPRRYLDMYNGIPISKPVSFDDDLKGYPGKPRCFANAQNKIGTIETGDSARSLEEMVKDYYAGLTAVDDNIGRVLDFLESSGQLDDTVTLHSSDHGFFLGEWRLFDKRFMHEPSIRTPAMIRYPKAFKAGTKVNEMILNLDFAPTLLELAGVAVPESMQGKSLVKLAQGNESQWRQDWLYEYFDYPGAEEVRPHRGVRTTRYKYIHYFLDPQEYEFYDLQDDPGELNNLYGMAAHARTQQTLAMRLEELRRETRDATTNAIV